MHFVVALLLFYLQSSHIKNISPATACKAFLPTPCPTSKVYYSPKAMGLQSKPLKNPWEENIEELRVIWEPSALLPLESKVVSKAEQILPFSENSPNPEC